MINSESATQNKAILWPIPKISPVRLNLNLAQPSRSFHSLTKVCMSYATCYQSLIYFFYWKNQKSKTWCTLVTIESSAPGWSRCLFLVEGWTWLNLAAQHSHLRPHIALAAALWNNQLLQHKMTYNAVMNCYDNDWHTEM